MAARAVPVRGLARSFTGKDFHDGDPSAAGARLALEFGSTVGPDDDLAAIAKTARIGANDGCIVDARRGCIRH